MVQTNQQLLELSQEISTWILAAGQLAKELRQTGQKLDISLKQGRDWVTNADLAVDSFLREKINTNYPEHSILSEELNPQQNTNLPGGLWIIDPIDGTHNYALGLNYSAVSIAYAYNQTVQIGAVYDFFNNELFMATKGHGATINGQGISPSRNTDLSKSHILLGQQWPTDPLDQYLKQINNVLANCRDYRRLGAGALDICMVAAGRAEAFFETLMPWDIAAARLIAAEVGCQIGHYGSTHDTPALPQDLNARHFLVAAPGIYSQLLDLIRI